MSDEPLEPVIEVSNLTVEFRLGRRHGILLKQRLANLFGKKIVFQKVQTVEALGDVSFSVDSGTVLGAIGVNGAGKSTLLRTLANIIPPKRGQVVCRGSVVPLINLGAGFNTEMTGRENIFLTAAIHRLPRREMVKKVDGIVEFAELEKFIDTPVKYYSSGMLMRLGFAIATDIDPEILLVDEVFAAGDEFFKRKCEARMIQLMQRARAVVMVSHSLPLIQRLCNEVLVLHEGKLVFRGEPDAAVEYYLENCGEPEKSKVTAKASPVL